MDVGAKMNKGFTLIETIVITAIIAIISSFSISGLHYFIEKQKVIADSNSVIQIISLAKSNAIKLNQAVMICGEKTDTACSSDWSSIKLVSKENPVNLIYQLKLKSNLATAKWSAFQRKSYLSFNGRGFTEHLNGSLYLCHNRYKNLHRVIKVAKSGRARIVKTGNNLNQRCQS